MSRISVLIAYTVVFTIAGCGLPPPEPIRTDSDGGIIGNGTEDMPLRLAPSAPSDMKLRVYTGGDGGLTGTGAPDDPLRLTGSYIENRAADAGAQNASFNITGSGAVNGAFKVGANAGIGAAPLENYALHAFGNLWIGSRDGSIANPKLHLGTSTGDNQYAALEYQYNGGNGAERLLLRFPNNSDQFAITPDGNVGIGTTDPFSSLTVRKSQNSETQVAVSNLSKEPGASAGLFLQVPVDKVPAAGTIIRRYSGSSSAISDAGNPLAKATLFATSGAGTNFIFNPSTGGDYRFEIGPKEAMRVNSVGNVGIGTANPTEALQVAEGNILVTNTTQSGAYVGMVELRNNKAKPQKTPGQGNGGCDCGHVGAITYEQTGPDNAGHFFGCRGVGGGKCDWTPLGQ